MYTIPVDISSGAELGIRAKGFVSPALVPGVTKIIII